jgi:hypothetical protein
MPIEYKEIVTYPSEKPVLPDPKLDPNLVQRLVQCPKCKIPQRTKHEKFKCNYCLSTYKVSENIVPTEILKPIRLTSFRNFLKAPPGSYEIYYRNRWHIYNKEGKGIYFLRVKGFWQVHRVLTPES